MLVGRGVKAFVFAGGVVAPVAVEVAAGDHGAQSQDGFGSGQAPAGAGDVEAVGDQVAAGSSTAPVAIGHPLLSAVS